MNDDDLEALVMKLRSTTQLARLSHVEATSVVRVIILAVTAPKTGA